MARIPDLMWFKAHLENIHRGGVDVHKDTKPLNKDSAFNPVAER